jgi:hypothetical protein
MLCHVALVRTDVSEELSASFIRVTRIGELGTTLAATSNRRTLEFLSQCEEHGHTHRTVHQLQCLVEYCFPPGQKKKEATHLSSLQLYTLFQERQLMGHCY